MEKTIAGKQCGKKTIAGKHCGKTFAGKHCGKKYCWLTLWKKLLLVNIVEKLLLENIMEAGPSNCAFHRIVTAEVAFPHNYTYLRSNPVILICCFCL